MLRGEPPAIRRSRGLLELRYDAVQRALRADDHRSPLPAFGELDKASDALYRRAVSLASSASLR